MKQQVRLAGQAVSKIDFFITYSCLNTNSEKYTHYLAIKYSDNTDQIGCVFLKWEKVIDYCAGHN